MGDFPEFLPLHRAPEELLDQVLELNRRNEQALSPLDHAALARMAANAFRAVASSDGEAFLIAFDQDADYDSPNFAWFKARYPRFVYVDRIAVAAGARGRGLAGSLYRALIDEAAGRAHSVLTCEINLDPPNPASDGFHAAFGFEEVGFDRLSNGKTVRYLVKRLG